MDEQLIAALVAELEPALVGRALGKVWLVARAALVLDFRLRADTYLLVAAEPHVPRLHLVRRAVRELERQALPPDPFVLALRRRLSGATLLALTKDAGDRVARLRFEARDEIGAEQRYTLITQLTGRAANVLLLDGESRVIAALRPPRGAGQEIGEPYQPPPQAARVRVEDETAPPPFTRGAFASLSEAADEYYQRLEAERAFAARAAALAARLRQETARREKLRANLARDRAAHGDAEAHRRAGDLLLANLATAERHGARVRLTDYYAEGAPTVELEMDEHATLQEEAARRFARYAKAKRAAHEIDARLAALGAELAALAQQRAELERATNARDADALADLAARLDKAGGRGRRAPAGGAAQRQRAGAGKGAAKRARETEADAVARRYRSSDGYEILVGRGARQNDQLTFRLARPHDLWLHAADYPGSHVVVRNPRRADIPHRTVIEAAQLAANYSQAKRDAKVAVNYTQRKFVAKPKGAAPGLVRMASFRTLLVEPREAGERV